MIHSYDFLKFVIDSVPEHIVVIDREGVIQFVNRTWVLFGRENSSAIPLEWHGVNYLKVCDESAAMGEELGKKAADGIRKEIEQPLGAFYLEYPCHSPDKKRWFMMRVAPFQCEGRSYFVISHQNITERKLAEEEVVHQSQIDGLTKIHNRKYFDLFLNDEWKRCARLHLPISLALMDIDHFKILNDRYGHQAGDACLVRIGEVLNGFRKRPGDRYARYGGEEFSLVFGNTTLDQSLALINTIRDDIRGLNIPNEASPVRPTVTVSIGLAMMYPDERNNEKDLIQAADTLLYAAKKNGRDQVTYSRDAVPRS